MHRIIFLIPVLILFPLALQAQEKPYEDLLHEKAINEDPVYKPVIGFGTGVLNFHGDVSNNFFNPVIGDNAFKFNISAYLDPERFFKANFFFIFGSMTGNLRSLSDISNNLNFKTDIVNFGINAEYGFNHIFRNKRWISPFISAGLGNLQFGSKGDLFDINGYFYNYWSDGTIRDIPESQALLQQSRILNRDFIYETDLRKWEKDQYGLGNYGKYAFSFPLEAGLDFKISSRVNCRFGTSMHFTRTDFLDNVSSTGTSVPGNKKNDRFSYSYFTIHFDLFSQKKEEYIDKLFIELEADNLMYEDEDGDFIPDPSDKCPGTPLGIIVDSRGCPSDKDADGVPDYLDLEPNTPVNNWVDKNGVTVTEESFMAFLEDRKNAISRKDVQAYFNVIGEGYVRKGLTVIPKKFKILDIDKDGYISFDELLKAIDNYFDATINLTVNDIYELNKFFFSQ